MEIGNRLRELREEMELTQKDAAGLLGISETFYGEIERGHKRLSIEKLVLLRRNMGADLTYILTGDRFTPEFLYEIYRQCPEEKRDMMEELFREIPGLYQ